jgi:hypothetical protein
MTTIGIDGEDWLFGATARKRAFFDFLAEVTGAAGLDPALASRAERIER